eukprot:TRINITY_DN59260_c0_g1_i1.p1 TRINITY_DN59260_c0_g1~~TRINITY_DN59260_c0_g1_i1.p1  ORF type:complete len:683 (-),score=7.36 TRINITY_DN59260_c0_g1_i1:250-2256(-)
MKGGGSFYGASFKKEAHRKTRWGEAILGPLRASSSNIDTPTCQTPGVTLTSTEEITSFEVDQAQRDDLIAELGQPNPLNPPIPPKLMKTRNEAIKKNPFVRRLTNDIEDPHRDLMLGQSSLRVCVCSLLGTVLMHIPLGMDPITPSSEKDAAWYISLVFQVLVTLSTLLSIVFILQFYMLNLFFIRVHSIIPYISYQTSVDIWRTKIIWLLSAEILLHLVHPIPMYNHHSDLTIFVVPMYCRIYTLLRPLKYFSDGFVNRFFIFTATTSARKSYSKWTWALTARVIFFRHTTIVISVIFLYTLHACTFAVWIVERDIQEAFATYENCLWFTFVSFSTIGYGDMTPVTHLGRLIAVLGGIIGLVVANMFAAILANKLTPSPQQVAVHSWLEMRDAREAYYIACIVLAQRWWRRRKVVKDMIVAQASIPRIDSQPGGSTAQEGDVPQANTTYLLRDKKLYNSVSKVRSCKHALDSFNTGHVDVETLTIRSELEQTHKSVLRAETRANRLLQTIIKETKAKRMTDLLEKVSDKTDQVHLEAKQHSSHLKRTAEQLLEHTTQHVADLSSQHSNLHLKGMETQVSLSKQGEGHFMSQAEQLEDIRRMQAMQLEQISQLKRQQVLLEAQQTEHQRTAVESMAQLQVLLDSVLASQHLLTDFIPQLRPSSMVPPP